MGICVFERGLTGQILVVTHGAFAHFLTEDWDVEDPMLGTAYKNCKCMTRDGLAVLDAHGGAGEHRVFVFTPESTAEKAHVEETWESRRSRAPQQVETDPHVVEEFLETAA